MEPLAAVLVQAAAPGPRLLTLALGAAALLSLALFLSQFRKNKELIKARLFLLFDQIQRIALVLTLLGMAGMAAHLAFAGTTDPNFETWERFWATGVYASVVYGTVLAIGLIGFLALSPVGKGPKGGP
ncbi:MAG: hypothetical protein QXO51_03740 [Halobacteria archaeon]